MIRTCRVCSNKYTSDNRGWSDAHILHVCGGLCFTYYILDQTKIYDDLCTPFSKSQGVVEFKNSDRSMRSGYEQRFLKYVKKLGLPFRYEPFKFEMPDRDFYVPDFLINDTVFFEVKGIWDRRGKSKFKSFIQNYPAIPIFVVDYSMLSLLGRRG